MLEKGSILGDRKHINQEQYRKIMGDKEKALNIYGIFAEVDKVYPAGKYNYTDTDYEEDDYGRSYEYEYEDELEIHTIVGNCLNLLSLGNADINDFKGLISNTSSQQSNNK